MFNESDMILWSIVPYQNIGVATMEYNCGVTMETNNALKTVYPCWVV